MPGERRICRVFPRRTSQTPTDSMAFVGYPSLIRPEADEVHVSVVFTWDIPEAEKMADAWRAYYPVLRIGGPAYGQRSGDFVPGRYVRPGVTFSSHGCPNRCDFCMVRDPWRALPIQPGNLLQDDNFLAGPWSHLEAVIQMLKTQKLGRVEFTGGLEAGRITPRVVELLRSLTFRQLFTAYDKPEDAPAVQAALERLTRAGCYRRQLRCYVLIGRDGDTVDAARGRLENVWKWGGVPCAMYFVGANGQPCTDPQWRELRREWIRPAAMFASHKSVKVRSRG